MINLDRWQITDISKESSLKQGCYMVKEVTLLKFLVLSRYHDVKQI